MGETVLVYRPQRLMMVSPGVTHLGTQYAKQICHFAFARSFSKLIIHFADAQPLGLRKVLLHEGFHSSQFSIGDPSVVRGVIFELVRTGGLLSSTAEPGRRAAPITRLPPTGELRQK